MPFLSEPLQAFLRERLASFEQVEIVLLLRSDPERSWTAPEVAGALRSAPESAAMRLFLLASNGLVQFEAAGVPRYRFAGHDPETSRILGELADACAHNRPGVAEFLGAPPADPIKSFSDAFKLKK